MEHFEIIIKSFLEEKAKSDPHFAERLRIKTKSVNECCRYIIAEVEKKAKAERRWAACTDDEVFGLAIHYWDEDDIKVGITGACRVVTPRKLTADEKKEAEALRKSRTAEAGKAKAKEKKKPAAAPKTAGPVRKETAEQKPAKPVKQEDGTLFLFGEEDWR